MPTACASALLSSSLLQHVPAADAPVRQGRDSASARFNPTLPTACHLPHRERKNTLEKDRKSQINIYVSGRSPPLPVSLYLSVHK